MELESETIGGLYEETLLSEASLFGKVGVVYSIAVTNYVSAVLFSMRFSP